jgi:hypothetical protein
LTTAYMIRERIRCKAKRPRNGGRANGHISRYDLAVNDRPAGGDRTVALSS